MLVKIASANKKKLVKSRVYMGTGMYKEGEDVWNLNRNDEGIWIISKVAREYKPLDDIMAKNYWSKVLGKELSRQLFKKKTVASEILVNADAEDFNAQAIYEITDLDTFETDKAFVNMYKENNKFYVNAHCNEKDFKIPLSDDIQTILARFKGNEETGLMIEVMGSETFCDHLIKNIFKNKEA